MAMSAVRSIWARPLRASRATTPHRIRIFSSSYDLSTMTTEAASSSPVAHLLASSSSNNILETIARSARAASTRQDNFAVVGLNGSGKKTLLNEVATGLLAAKGERRRVEVVDFLSHRALLRSDGEEIVARVLGGMKESTDLIVRFGLTPIWWKRVSALSTGEIRRVLLARAVSRSPDVLVLDRPFDGLDVKGRNVLLALLEEISQMQNGRTVVKPLVQGIQWRDRSRVVIVLSTHRPLTEMPRTVNHIILCRGTTTGEGEEEERRTKAEDVSTTYFADPRRFFEEHLMRGPPPGAQTGNDGRSVTISPRNSATSWWTPMLENHFARRRISSNGLPQATHEHSNNEEENNNNNRPILEITHLTVLPPSRDGETPRPLLNRVSWTVHPREVWWIQGENGASKSVLLNAAVGPEALMRLAMTQHLSRTWEVEPDTLADRRRRRPPIVKSTDSVAVVSTELHIAVLESSARVPVRELLRRGGGRTRHRNDDDDETFDTLGEGFLRALGIGNPASLMDLRFERLSLGEQKLVLLAKALMEAPRLLVLDEACQSLDWWHRARVAELVAKLTASPTFDCSVVFVSHHEDELPRNVSHRLHIAGGTIVSRGPYTVRGGR